MEAGILGGLKLMSIPSSEIRELFCFTSTSTSSLATGSWNLTFFLDLDFLDDLGGVVTAGGGGNSTSLIEALVILLVVISDSADNWTAIIPNDENFRL